MKKNYTHITVLLDSSGSMESIKKDTIGGISSFIKEQKLTANPFDTISFALFRSNFILVAPLFFEKNKENNNFVNYIHDMDNINKIKDFENFTPAGGTPLYDSVREVIDDTGKKLSSLSEENRPEKVIFVVVTDGEENSSINTSSKEISDIIKHQMEVYHWNFMYLGANQDAILSAKNMGISAASSMSYGTSGIEISSSYDSLSRAVNNMKLANNYEDTVRNSSFTENDRARAKINS